MPTNNFLVWNPNAANQDSDTAYAGDSSRAGGAPAGSILVSPLANKLFYQLSTMVAAIAGYLVSQGQNAQDSNLAVLIANIQAAIANQIATVTRAAMVLVGFSATPVFDASQGNNFEIHLTGNVTSSSLVNVLPGQRVAFVIRQDGTGNRNFVWPGNVVGAGAIDPGANTVSVQEFICDVNGNVRPLTPMTVS